MEKIRMPHVFTHSHLGFDFSNKDLTRAQGTTLVSIYTDHNPTGGRFFPSRYGMEEFRIKCYNDEADCFSPHVDVGDAASSRRFLAFLFYLNDNFDGGNTEFRLPNKQVIKPEKGSVSLAFLSIFLVSVLSPGRKPT